MELTFIPCIMAVESYPDNFKSLSSHLTSLGIPLRVLTEYNADSVLSRLQRETTNLVIIDSCLNGGMDGFDLCRCIRLSDPGHHLPIILLLDSYVSLERSKGILAGADLVLYRPIVKEELSNAINALLGPSLEQAEKFCSAVEREPLQRLGSAI